MRWATDGYAGGFFAYVVLAVMAIGVSDLLLAPAIAASRREGLASRRVRQDRIRRQHHEPLSRPPDLLQRSTVDTSPTATASPPTKTARWEDGYRKRWQHDKIVRSTHGVNCTGSCSWKIYVKGGIVTWETQQTDYPRTRPDLPNHEPRGCSRGASYSWYLYSGNRREIPAGALASAAAVARGAGKPRRRSRPGHRSSRDPEKRASYTSKRGLGGFVRATWDEVNEIIAAANAYTDRRRYGPDRVVGFSPIPAMSMVSLRRGRALPVAARRRLHVVLRLVLRPAAVQPADLGRADRRAGKRRLVQCRLPDPVGLERAADAHARRPFLHRGALQRRQERRHLARTMPKPRSSPICGCIPKQGTDAALAMAMGHVILREFHLDRQAPYFSDYCPPVHRLPMLVRLVQQGRQLVPERLRARLRFRRRPGRGQQSGMEDGRLATPRGTRWCRAVRSVSAGASRANGTWSRRRSDGADTSLQLSLIEGNPTAEVAFPYFGGAARPSSSAPTIPICVTRNVPVRTADLEGRGEAWSRRCSISSCANYGLDRGLGGGGVAPDYDDDEPYTPAWAERDHRRAARPDHHSRARVRHQRREDERPLHGDPRGRDEPLVPHGHELPRHHQPAGDVRLRRPVGRRLVALCRAGEAAPADRLAAAGLRARLEPPAAAA